MNERRIERRARCLVALYPRAWRERFGEEFEQLLIDEMHERPRSSRWVLDVAAHAVWARLVQAGVARADGAAPLRAWIALRGLAVVSALFVAVGAGVWSQLTIGWQWSAPSGSATRAGMLMMSAALFGLGALVVLALIPVGCSVLGAGHRRQPGARRWSLVSVACAVTFVLACRHFGAGWPGTGGHHWSGRGLIPGAVARIVWAGTLWISAYWAHPGALHAFPLGELLWMAASPVLIAAGVAAALRAAGQLVLPAGALRWLALLGGVGVGLGAVFVAGATSWILSGTPGPHRLFQVGLIDDLGLLVLALTLVAGSHSARRAIAAAVRLQPR